MTGEQRRFLLFRIGKSRYAIALQDVTEVRDPLPEFPIPRAPDFLRGVVNIHGTLVPVLDQPLFLGQKQALPCGELLVLNRADVALALSVERVEKIVTESAILGEEPEAGETAVSTTLFLEDGSAQLLSVIRLLRAVEEALSG